MGGMEGCKRTGRLEWGWKGSAASGARQRGEERGAGG